jgi:hypothetical protein
MFVDRVVEHFENTVVQTAFVRIADVHAGAFSHRFQALELVYFGGIVLINVIGHKIRKTGQLASPVCDRCNTPNRTPEIRTKIYEIPAKTQIYFNATNSVAPQQVVVCGREEPDGLWLKRLGGER